MAKNNADEAGIVRLDMLVRYSRKEVALAFGATLREARRLCGFTQDSLSMACDFDRTYPSLMERGRRQPTLHMLFRLADAMEVAPEKLVADARARLRKSER
jgi:transcriptional regulator with XRE-family HTH domain